MFIKLHLTTLSCIKQGSGIAATRSEFTYPTLRSEISLSLKGQSTSGHELVHKRIFSPGKNSNRDKRRNSHLIYNTLWKDSHLCYNSKYFR